MSGQCYNECLSQLQVLCFADINRAGSQLIRGGGAACFIDNPGMWKLFNSIIDIEEECQDTCPSDAHGLTETDVSES